jgi:hypothetical protein
MALTWIYLLARSNKKIHHYNLSAVNYYLNKKFMIKLLGITSEKHNLFLRSSIGSEIKMYFNFNEVLIIDKCDFATISCRPAIDEMQSEYTHKDIYYYLQNIQRDAPTDEIIIAPQNTISKNILYIIPTDQTYIACISNTALESKDLMLLSQEIKAIFIIADRLDSAYRISSYEKMI